MDVGLLARIKMYLLKALELPGRLRNTARRRQPDVELNYLAAGQLSIIDDVCVNAYFLSGVDLVRFDRQVLIAEAGIGEAMPKGKQRLDSFGVIMPVADEDAFGIMRHAVHSRILFRLAGRHIFQLPR